MYVLRTIEETTQEAPCKKKVQKIVYLIENSDGHLGYKYGIHLYGPYSAALDQEITRLLWNEQLEIISPNGMSHTLNRKDKTEFSLSDHNKKTSIDKIIQKYAKQTPSELELLTTTLYVMQNISIQEFDILKWVKEIKGTKYSDKEIQDAAKKLKNDTDIIKRIA
ncbi:hypothetical protein FACS1894211_05270 [Clostridia bacterium]|nr:hypothetical protein FACS1894211_05270 [Clostridia bacterium]